MNITEDIIIHNKNCFEVFPTLEDKSINLFILDLPYGQTACKWDTVIDLEQMWKDVKRIMKPNALIVFFCTAKFGYTLIHSNPKWFKYDLIWKKSRKVGFLSANKMPLRQHENIYVFKDKQGTYHPQKTEGKPNIGIIEDKDLGEIDGGYYRGENGKPFKRMPPSKDGTRHPTSIIDHENIYVFDNPVNEEYNDLELSRNKDLREYAEKVFKFIGKTKKQIIKKIGQKIDHFSRFKSSQFGLATKETYDELIKEYNIDEMEGYLEYDILKDLWEESPQKYQTYNPQKTEGEAYKCKQGQQTNLYGIEGKEKVTTENKGDRHPTSIIDHENIYVFDNTITDDIELSRNKDLREYAEKVKKFIGKGLKTINKKLGHRRAEHFFYFKTSQFGLATKETYDELIKEYNIDEMEEYLEYDILEGLWEKEPSSIYNPQKTEGKAYKSKERTEVEGVYIKDSYKRTATQDTKHRHPTSIIPEYEGDTILIYKNPHKTIHRTQKPVELLEWLIKTYSNEGDTVMDFTMGSGTCGIACMNQKRKFIGVEMDKEIYEAAKNRFEDHKKKSVIVI